MKAFKYDPYNNSGSFRHRITFVQPAGGTDEYGFPVTEPTEYVKVWAKLRTLKGRTFYEAAKTNMQHNREFTIRYTKKLEDGVRPKDLQLVWKGITHDIVSIENDDGLNKTMTVVAKAVE